VQADLCHVVGASALALTLPLASSIACAHAADWLALPRSHVDAHRRSCHRQIGSRRY